MTEINKTIDASSINRELGETSTRMDDHQRRLGDLESEMKVTRQRLENIVTRLGSLEKNSEAI